MEFFDYAPLLTTLIRMLGSNGCGLACSLVTNYQLYDWYLAIYFAALPLSSCSNHDCDRIQAQRGLYS